MEGIKEAWRTKKKGTTDLQTVWSGLERKMGKIEKMNSRWTEKRLRMNYASSPRNMMALIACQRERKQPVDIFGGSKNVGLLRRIL